MTLRICVFRVLANTAVALIVPVAATAQDAVDGDVESAARVAPAVRTAAPPVVDGSLDDTAWADGTLLVDFIQSEPREGDPVSEHTEVRVVYDDDALYIGAWLHDNTADRIVPGERRRDASLSSSDAFLMIVDTYRDGQNGFVFGTNPSGIEYDGQVTNEGRGGGQGRQQGGAAGGFNINWDGSWRVATSRDENGWYAEFRIPLSTLRYGGGSPQTWGINFARNIAHTNEEAFWAAIPRQFNLYRLSFAGTLEGLEIPPQRNVSVTPYALTSAQRRYDVDQEFDYPYEIGADAKIGVTRGLTLDLTYNTDFAQVEVDEEQVNLTRFNLFFPEKRPFFLENAGLFSVGSSSSAQMFFSRRIGVGPTGQIIPIQGGGRLTGRAGGVDVGLLHIRTDGTEDADHTNAFSVARVSKELPNRSRIGGFFGYRGSNAPGDDYNRSYAVDGRLGIGNAFTLDAMVAGTETPDVSGSEHAITFQGNYQTADVNVRAGYNEIGENFNPEVGFIPRRGYRGVSTHGMYYLRTPQISWLRELRPHASYDVTYAFDGFKLTETLHLDSHVEWEDGMFFSPAFDYVVEGLTEPFEISPGVFVPAGTYSGWMAAWRFNTSENRTFWLDMEADAGSLYSGSLIGGAVGLNYRQGSTITGSLSVGYNDIDLPEGDFTTTLLQGRLSYAFTPSIFAQSLIQYNEQTQLWSGNVRFGWLNTAGTGLFLVYNEIQETGTGIRDVLGPRERAFFVKFTHQFDLLRGY